MAASMGGYGASTADSAGPKNDTININGHTNLKLTLNIHAPTAPDPWVTSQAMPHIIHALRQAGHSETVSDELTRALGLLAAHGVLQLTQSAALAAPTTQQWAGEAASAYGASYGSSNGYGDTSSAYGYGTPAAQPPAPQPPSSAARIGYGAQKPIGANRYFTLNKVGLHQNKIVTLILFCNLVPLQTLRLSCTCLAPWTSWRSKANY